MGYSAVATIARFRPHPAGAPARPGRRAPIGRAAVVNVPWHRAFTSRFLRQVEPPPLFTGITPEEAWGGATGRGVRVAVIDSGIEATHPAVGGMVRGGVMVVE